MMRLNESTRSLCWLIMLFQLAFPLSVAFVPAIAATPFSTGPLPLPSTVSYVLSGDDTVTSIAIKYQLTVAELQRINQLRTFSKPFMALTLGDEIDVPSRIPPKILGVEAANNITGEASQDDRWDSQLASTASQLGRVAASGDATRQAHSMASGVAGQSAQKWLSQFGTARVQLGLDDNFSLEGSALDLLFPLYDSKNVLLFTQLGVRYQDERATSNLGGGIRTYTDGWMYGANLFFDNDMTGDNRRIGIGAEAWADYVKLSANTYLGYTNWHQSRDFADYNERPANGYDIRAEAYLPAYPQLGSKLMYEQYYGDDVALFGKNDRQRNPYAVTVGLSYTPVKLMTFGFDQRQGKNGQSDTRFNVQFTYQLGEPWDKQIDSQQVGITRTLAGNRYDLVERNNVIVLEYQKQALIRLSLPPSANGKTGDVLSLPIQVTSKYGVERIEWDAGSLIAAGGKIAVQGNAGARVTLPPYLTGSAALNHYDVKAIAVDVRGNTSNSAIARVQVNGSSGMIDLQQTTFSIQPATLVGNGSDTATLTFTARDENDQPVSGLKVTFNVSGVAGSTHGTTTETAGIYTALLTGTLAGTLTVKPEVNGVAVSGLSETMTVIADGGSAIITPGHFVMATNNAVANGVATNVVQATVTDAHGNPVSGQKVVFTSVANVTVTTVTGTTGAEGLASATLTSAIAGTYPVTVTQNSAAQLKSVTRLTINTTFIGDTSTADITGDAITTNNAVANGLATNAITFTITDAQNNPLEGQTVNFTRSNPDVTLIPATSTTDAGGLVNVTVTSRKAGTSTVTAALSNGQQRTGGDMVFQADAGSAVITPSHLVMVSNNAVANGVATNTVQATVTDANGNPVSGQTVVFTSGTNMVVTTVTGTTGAEGLASATVTSTIAGTHPVTVSLNGVAVGINATFIGDVSTADITGDVITANNALANGVAANAISFTITDAQGNPLEGQRVSFTYSNLNETVVMITSKATDANGLVEARLTSRKAGTGKVTVVLSNGQQRTGGDMTFLADGGTAVITPGNLVMVSNNALANGVAANIVQATVTDANGNPVSGQTVVFTSGANMVVTGATGMTGAEGLASATVTSTIAGTHPVTVSLNGVAVGINATFIGDVSTADITGDAITANNALANGVAANVITFTITDARGNPLDGQKVAFLHSNPNTMIMTTNNTTDVSGLVKVTLTSTAAGTGTVTAALSNGRQRTGGDMTFLADGGTAVITPSHLVMVSNNAVANGVATNTVQATVTDANGNPLSGQTVVFTSVANVTVTTVTGTTGADGLASAILTSTQATSHLVTATLDNGRSASVNAIFRADESTAHLVRESISSSGGGLANGVDAITLEVKVIDAQKNAIEGMTVSFRSTDDQMVMTPVSGVSGVDGVVKTALTSTRAGSSVIWGKLQGGSEGTIVNTVFRADPATARIAPGALKMTSDGAVADGLALNIMEGMVTDANDNPLDGQVVHFDVYSSDVHIVGANPQMTRIGFISTGLSSTTPGIYTLTARLDNGVSATISTTFIP